MSDTVLDLPETMHIESDAEDAPPAGDRQKSPRELMMESIAARAQQAREAEMATGAEYDAEARRLGLTFPADEPEPVTAPDPEPVAHQPVAPAVAAPTPSPEPVQQQPQTFVVNVEGQQFAVNAEQYQQLARMGAIAGLALQNYQPEQATYQPPAPAPIVDPGHVKSVVEKIQYSNPDEGAEALAGLIQQVVARVPAAPAVDQNAIVARAVAEAQAQARLAADTATIRQEYSDIFANPQLTVLARLNVDAIRQRNAATGRFQSDLDIYREAGNAVYDAMGRPRPGSQVDTSPALQAAPAVQHRADVVERKRAAPRQTQVIDRRAPAPEMPRPPSNSDVVELMRKSRGQTSMR